jgi:hypothetical protein
MNECIELAKRFGTTIPGRIRQRVLDKIAQQATAPSKVQGRFIIGKVARQPP